MSAKHLLRAAFAGEVLHGASRQPSAVEDPHHIRAF